MYLIAVYDIGTRRLPKMLKLFRQYLHWVQNSVFEGELTESQVHVLTERAGALMDPDTDSLILYRFSGNKYLRRDIYGLQKGQTDHILE
ncbi:MAG: CRISPR-associated endonuclease Cas2 [Bacteroidetes bacterium]|nr:CRISPR-associated endonuclease Cas2 [Bacteroidota bacterium]